MATTNNITTSTSSSNIINNIDKNIITNTKLFDYNPINVYIPRKVCRTY